MAVQEVVVGVGSGGRVRTGERRAGGAARREASLRVVIRGKSSSW